MGSLARFAPSTRDPPTQHSAPTSPALFALLLCTFLAGGLLLERERIWLTD